MAIHKAVLINTQFKRNDVHMTPRIRKAVLIHTLQFKCTWCPASLVKQCS